MSREGVIIRTAGPSLDAKELDHWSIVTAGTGAYYLVDEDSMQPPAASFPARMPTYRRAYRYLEQFDPTQGLLRAVILIAASSGKLGVELQVLERVPLADLSDVDRKVFCTLIDAAEDTRVKLRAELNGVDARPGEFRPPGDGQRGARRG